MKKPRAVTVKRRADEIKIGDIIMRPIFYDFREVIRIEHWAGHRLLPGGCHRPPPDVVELHFGERDYMVAFAWQEQIVRLDKTEASSKAA